jgi:hypothetical protein
MQPSARKTEPHTHMQVLFLGGLFLIIGPQKTFFFFARRNKLRGTICFLGGILLVFLKWPTIGVLVEMFGFLNLFGCVSQVPVHQYKVVERQAHYPRFISIPVISSPSSSLSSANCHSLATS